MPYFDDDSVDDPWSVFFHEVQNEGGFPGAVGMEKTGVKLESGIVECRPTIALQYGVAVIQTNVGEFL